jgi:hypothetical protein
VVRPYPATAVRANPRDVLDSLLIIRFFISQCLYNNFFLAVNLTRMPAGVLCDVKLCIGSSFCRYKIGP